MPDIVAGRQSVVVDASVAAKWILQEEGSDAARALQSESLHAPSLLRIEIGNLLRALYGSNRIGEANAIEVLNHMLRAPVTLHEPSDTLMDGALRIALRIGHPLYDCLYLALSIELGVPLVTADGRFLRALSRSPDLDGIAVAPDGAT